MNKDRWEEAKKIFNDALDLPADDLPAFLDTACAGDPDLQVMLDELLKSYDSEFLEEPSLADAGRILAHNVFESGKIIGRYRLGEVIGEGGMGQVFLADDTELDRPVAFKFLHPDVAQDDERVRRFIQEAKAASALNHPNILTIYEIGSFEGSRFIVSEYVDGDTLRELMHKGVNAAQSVDIACQVAAALQAAHSAGIVHRDIKPENVMIRRDGLVKVLDFGLAKLTEADEELRNSERGMRNEDSSSVIPHSALRDPHLTAPGLVMGTVAYMSPEQARGQAVDARTDLWSLGVVLHEMLTGTSPFEGESVTDLLASILRSESTPPVTDTLPDGLRPICQKALAKDKDSRYRSAQDLLNDLQGEKKRMENAIEITPFISVSSTDELKTQLIRPRPTLSAEYIVSSVKRHKYASLAVAAAVAFMAIGFSVYQFSGAPKPDQNSDLAAIGPATTESDLTISRIPSSGRIVEIAISPDGKYVAYVTQDSREKNGIRLLQLETSSDRELVPAPNSEDYDDLAFSPDGNYLYYVLFTFDKEQIYRIPVTGGASTLVVDKSECGAGVSPDGKTIVFHRRGDDKADVLAVADVNGANERILARSAPDGSGSFNCGGVPKWSPDGKEIACWARYSEKNDTYLKIFGLNVADGSRRLLSEKRWASVDSAAYMPNGHMLITGREFEAQAFGYSRLWLIAPNVEPKPITTDPSGYTKISVTRAGDTIVTLRDTERSDLWLLPNNDVGDARQITSSGEIVAGFTWTTDGRIVYSSGITGTAELWAMDTDGSRRKRLTIDQGIHGRPATTRDGKYLLFHSTRADGRFHLFRADPAGANSKQLTNGFRETRGRPSPDGKWVYYIQGEPDGPNRIAKVSMDGGVPIILGSASPGEQITDLDVSKDGRVAYEIQWNPVDGADVWKKKIIIIAPLDGKLIRSFGLPDTAQGGYIRWTPDGRSIAYSDNRDKSGDIWTIPVNGKTVPKRLTSFRTPRTNNFQWSIDGRQLLISRTTATHDAVIISRKN